MAQVTIDLAIGHPSTRLLATKQLALASQTVFASCEEVSEYDTEDRHPLQYGTDAGPLSVRRVIAEWFTTMYQLSYEVDPALLCITCGASAGLGNTCLQMTDPQYTRRIFMITPAYFLAAKIFEDAGYGDKMYGIDEEGEGFNVNQLRRVLEEDEKSQSWPRKAVLNGKRYKYLFYAVPTFSNPSGIVWDVDSRHNLLQLARQYDILIITDEVYDFLDYRRDLTKDPPLARFVDLDIQTLKEASVNARDYGNTISNMSFSKYIGPGLRIGTIQAATRKLADQWSSGGANHSGGAMAQHTSYYVAEMIKNGSMDSILARLRDIYADRSLAIKKELKEQMPADCVVHGGEGGYFLWLQLPADDNCDMNHIIELAKLKYNVIALSGSACEVPGIENRRNWGKSCIRLSLSKLETDDALEGIRRFGRAIREGRSQVTRQ